MCLKAGRCNNSVVLPRSTRTLCTSKLSIHKVSKCIIMRSDDLGRVYRRKGYRDVDGLNRCAAGWGTDGAYLGSD